MNNYLQTWSVDGVNLFCSLNSVEAFSIIIDIIYITIILRVNGLDTNHSAIRVV